jgi:hypothetical protein
MAPRLRAVLLQVPPLWSAPSRPAGRPFHEAARPKYLMACFNLVIMSILEIAGAALLLAPGVLWLALLWRIRLKLSAIEKELSRPRENAPRR